IRDRNGTADADWHPGYSGVRRGVCEHASCENGPHHFPGTRPMTHRIAITVAIAAAASLAHAEPAVVYDAGGKFDKSFNEAAYNGIERFKKETGSAYLDFEISNDTQREQALRRMAQKGADPIIAVGFGHASALEKVAKEFPNAHFALIDSEVKLPNVQSVLF